MCEELPETGDRSRRQWFECFGGATFWGILATRMLAMARGLRTWPLCEILWDDVSISLVERTHPHFTSWERPGHEAIGFHGRRQIPAVDATSSSHQHVLRTLHDLLSHAKQVGLLKGFEAKIVIAWKRETRRPKIDQVFPADGPHPVGVARS